MTPSETPDPTEQSERFRQAVEHRERDAGARANSEQESIVADDRVPDTLSPREEQRSRQEDGR